MSNFLRKGNLFSGILGFPPPEILRMPAFGLVISDHSIKAMKFRRQGNILAIEASWDEKMQNNEIVVSGNIKDKKTLREELLKVRDAFDIHFVHASVPEEKGYIFKVELPQAAIGDLHEATSLQIEEHIPLSSNEVVFDLEIISERNKKGNIEVIVSALPETFLIEYLQVFKEAGILPLSFELEAESTRRALVGKEETGTYLIVDVGRTRTGVSIVHNNITRYTSTLEMGGYTITQAIQKQLGVSFREAETIKQKEGLLKKGKDSNFYNAVVSAALVLKDEINKRRDYWDTHIAKEDDVKESEGKIEKIFFCGGNASVPGFAEHLSIGMDLPVERANVWANTFSFEDYIPEIDFNHSLALAPAIGLAIKDFM